MNRLGRLLAAAAIGIVLLIGMVSSFLFASPFVELRRSVAASYLAELLELDVVVRGDVQIELGGTPRSPLQM